MNERRCYLFTLLGAAGVGKSRLVREFLDGAADGATIVRGRCLSYGEGITFYPLVEMLMQLGEPAAGVLAHVSRGGAASAAELFYEVRRLLEQIGSSRPLIVVFDDLHWAEPTLLDLLDHIADLSREAPILLLCIARPELVEERGSWAGGKLNATSVLLEPLPPEESMMLVNQLAGVDGDARARVVEAGEGNPLFLEEMAAFVLAGGGLEMPPTIHALLAARLEQLAESERTVIERGAVEGKVFHRGAVRDLCPPALQGGVDSHLTSLVRKELIRPDEPVFHGDEAYRFRHLLIRDAAYDALPKAQRADLHLAFADWLEHRGARLVELDEIAGWHLEQALHYWGELGLPFDPMVAQRASGHLRAAGERAASRGDYPAAESLLDRALGLLSAGDEERGRVALALADALLHQGHFDRAEAHVDEAEADPSLRAEAVLARQEWLMYARPGEAAAYSDRELPAAIARFEEFGDDRLLAKAHFARLLMYQLTGVFGPAGDEAAAAANHARRAGDEGLLVQALTYLWWALLFGPADRATMEHGLAGIHDDEGGPSHTAMATGVRAVLAARAERFGEARSLFEEYFDMLQQLGLDTVREAARAQWSSRLELEADRPAEAVAQLRDARDNLEQLGERAFRSTATAFLGNALYAAGQFEEAERMALAAEGESAPEDSINFAMAHGVRARLAADRGDHLDAERLAESAVEYAYRMDMPLARADALCVRAHVLQASGRNTEAMSVIDDALAIYERKGDRAAANHARSVFAVTARN